MLTTTMLALLIGATPAAFPPAEAAVVEVVDGDTLDVTVEGVAETVRLVGIDTPEVGQCGFEEASYVLASLLGDGNVVLTSSDEDRDGYDRLLRYVTASHDDGAAFDVGLAMIESGYAIARYDSRDGYGHHFMEEQYIAADEATPDAITAACNPGQGLPQFLATPTTAAAEQPVVQAVEQSGNVFYQNCDAVRAAGAAPIHPGDPGWQDKFDRDNDGVGCE